jgi:hypothetical protein
MYWYRRKRKGRKARLCGLVLKVGDEVVAVLGLLQATEGHLGTGNVLLGVLEVLELKRESTDALLCYPSLDANKEPERNLQECRHPR